MHQIQTKQYQFVVTTFSVLVSVGVVGVCHLCLIICLDTKLVVNAAYSFQLFVYSFQAMHNNTMIRWPHFGSTLIILHQSPT